MLAQHVGHPYCKSGRLEMTVLMLEADQVVYMWQMQRYIAMQPA